MHPDTPRQTSLVSSAVCPPFYSPLCSLLMIMKDGLPICQEVPRILGKLIWKMGEETCLCTFSRRQSTAD